MEKRLKDDMEEILSDASTMDLRIFVDEIRGRLKRSEKTPSNVPDNQRGSAKDTAVQRLAARQLVYLKNYQGFSYREIGEEIGVTAERVRQLFERLCPEEYGKESIPKSG